MKMISFAMTLMIAMAGGYASGEMVFDFEDGTFQGWEQLTVINPTASGAVRWAVYPTDPEAWYQAGIGTPPTSGPFISLVNNGSADGHHNIMWLRSPAFKLSGAGDLSAWFVGGTVNGPPNPVGRFDYEVPERTDALGGFPNINGIALRDAASGEFKGYIQKPNSSGTWQQAAITEAQLAAMYAEEPEAAYTLDLIDAYAGGWGWIHVDKVTVPGVPYHGVPQMSPAGQVGVTSGLANWSPNPDWPGDPNYYTYTLYMSSDRNLLYTNPMDVGGARQINLGVWPGDLGYGVTWYWTVDAVAPDLTVYEGMVASFTTLGAEPIITQQPASSINAFAGEPVSFTVAAECPHGGPLTYAWYHGEAPGGVLAGNEATLSFTVTENDFGPYYCRITSTTSGGEAVVTVNLAEKKMLARWLLNDLENFQSLVPGTPEISKVGTGQIELVTGPAPGTQGIDFKGNVGFLTSMEETGDYFDSANNQITVTTWFRQTNLADEALISKNGVRNNTGWRLRTDSAYFRFVTYGTSNPAEPRNNTRYADGVWRHVAATYDGAVKRIYIDGVQVAQANSAGLIAPTASPVGIAVSHAEDIGLRNYFIGALHDARIYNYALNIGEINAMLNIGCDPIPGDLDNNCVVDMGDIAVLTSNWLTCYRYPDCVDTMP